MKKREDYKVDPRSIHVDQRKRDTRRDAWDRDYMPVDWKRSDDMSNKFTQDMTGTGQHVDVIDPGPEPERYNDWILWKLRQSPEWNKAVFGKPTFKDNIKQFLKTSSLALSIIFFIGHVLIAMAVVSAVTGASLWEAGAVALIEPAINSLWFYILHTIWKKYS